MPAGDFVDRGAWGVEILAMLMAYKWMLPRNVFLLRGNHESNIITQVYGFAAELKAKYGKSAKVREALIAGTLYCKTAVLPDSELQSEFEKRCLPMSTAKHASNPRG